MIHNYLPGQKVRYKPSGKIYDFGYASSGGVVVYEEGERNMQDSIAVDISDIEPAPATHPEIKEKELIKIRTLDRKHAQQILVIQYDRQPDSVFTRVAMATRPDFEIEEGRAKVLGWVPTEVLRDVVKARGATSVSSTILRYWLVQYQETLYWFPAPKETSEAGQAYKDLPQLFV